MIITKKAADKIIEIRKNDAIPETQVLRARVIGGGCSGFTYDLYFADEKTDMDEEYESCGVKIYVDPLSAQYISETEIDYVQDKRLGEGFKFTNDAVKSTCGCGSSFAM